MTNEAGGRGAAPAPLSLDDIKALRTDYRDVPVPDLGGHTLRLYALSGTARADLLGDMADIAGEQDEKDPTTVKRVFVFQSRCVAASLGYPMEQWDSVADALGGGTIESLYDIVADLSGLGAQAEAKVRTRLSRRRSAASGTG